MDEVDRAAEGVEFVVEGVTGGMEANGVAPHAQPFPDHRFGAEQGGGQHHLVGNEGRGTVAVAGLPAPVDLGGGFGPPLTGVGAVVEVRARGA